MIRRTILKIQFTPPHALYPNAINSITILIVICDQYIGLQHITCYERPSLLIANGCKILEEGGGEVNVGRFTTVEVC